MVTFKQSTHAWKALFNFKNYRNNEIVLKSFLLLIITPVALILWLLIWVFLGIERLMSPLFKRLISWVMRLFSQKAYQKGLKKFLLNLTFLIVLLISLPIVIIFYLSILTKIGLKVSLKNLILKLDFSIQFSKETLLIFDDSMQTKNAFSSLFKDASQTEAFGKMLEDLINDSPEGVDIVTDDSQERPN